MQQIRLKKRTAAERTAFLEGYYCGLNDGMRREQPCVVLKTSFLMTPEGAETIRANLIEQSKDGLILLPAGVHYMGTVGMNPEIRVLYDDDREDGYLEDDE